MDFKERVVTYLARNIYIFDSQVPGEDDPDPDTLWVMAKSLGVEQEVSDLYHTYEEEDDG